MLEARISERHRHRFEFKNEYREAFESHGFRLSGLSPDGRLVELIELDDHPYYMTQRETFEELKENLRDIYDELESGNIPCVRKVNVDGAFR